MGAVRRDEGGAVSRTVHGPVIELPVSRRTPAARPKRSGQKGRKRKAKAPRRGWGSWVAVGLETVALLGAALIAIIAALGRFSAWFAGADLWSSLLPFAAAVLGVGMVTAALWWSWRRATPAGS